MEGNRYFDFIDFNKEVFALCKEKGVDPEDITDEEWQCCYDLAQEDYDGALADAVFYATF